MEFLRPLEINVVSAHGLKDVNFLSKMDVYVYVSIGDEPKTRKRTPVDKDGGKSPKWNHRMNFTVDESFVNQQPNLCLWFRIKSQRPLGDRDIGHVAVPLKELFDSNPADGERTVEYQVRTPDGKAKGTLKFAYKIGPKFGTPGVAAAGSSAVAAGSSAVAAPKVKDSEPVTAYPSYGAGANNAYPAPPVTGYGPPPVGYAAPYAHPPPAASGYAHPPPAAAGYGYPPPHQAYPGGYPPAPGYGYPPQQQQGYGYPPVMQPPKKKKNNKMGLGLGAGLLGGLLVGDMIGDMGEMGAYDAGFDDGFGDAGFDF